MRRFEQGFALLRGHLKQVEPVIAVVAGGRAVQTGAGDTVEVACQMRVQARLVGQVTGDALQLRQRQGGVEVGHAVVECHLVMFQGAGMRLAGGGAQVARAFGQLRIAAQQGAAPAAADDLVAVEAEDG